MSVVAIHLCSGKKLLAFVLPGSLVYLIKSGIELPLSLIHEFFHAVGRNVVQRVFELRKSGDANIPVSEKLRWACPLLVGRRRAPRQQRQLEVPGLLLALEQQMLASFDGIFCQSIRFGIVGGCQLMLHVQLFQELFEDTTELRAAIGPYPQRNSFQAPPKLQLGDNGCRRGR